MVVGLYYSLFSFKKAKAKLLSYQWDPLISFSWNLCWVLIALLELDNENLSPSGAGVCFPDCLSLIENFSKKDLLEDIKV